MTPHNSAYETDERRLALALVLADAAREASLPHFRSGGAVETKQAHGFDPVTEADRAAERAMRALLAEHAPDDGVDGEEYGFTPGSTGWVWHLDPVDGTRAFVAGLPLWTVLIGAAFDGEPRIGVIDQPVLRERYIGDGMRAWLDTDAGRQPIRVSAQADLRQAILSTTDPFILTPPEQGAFTHLRHTARLTRYGLDAYAYARLAAGSIDIVAETGLQRHDVAALVPVVRGAGGVACNWRGEPARLGPQLVCAASQALLDQALISLRRSAL